MEIIFFLVIFSCLSVVFSRVIFEPTCHNTVLNKVERELAAYDPSANLAFMGDSHVFTSIDTREIPNTFVYAHINETYVQTYYTLKRLLDKKKKIQVVFLQYDFHSIVEKHREWDAIYFWRNLIDPFELDLASRTLPYHVFLYGMAAGVAPYINSLAVLLKANMKSSRKIIGNGFMPRLGTDALTAQDRNERLDTLFHTHDRTVKINQTSIVYLIKILDLLRAHNIKVCILRYPMHPAFYARVQEMINKDYYSLLLLDLQKKYNFLFLDYHDLFFKERCQDFACPHFRDFDHLNLEAATEFSKILKTSIVEHSFLLMRS